MQPALFDSSIYISSLRRGDDSSLLSDAYSAIRRFGSVRWCSRSFMRVPVIAIVGLSNG
jgi:hypothetical protein